MSILSSCRIYVDAVINHMAQMGRSGKGSAGTEFDADSGYFPGVPYDMDNFNDCSSCPQCCCINNYNDVMNVCGFTRVILVTALL